MATQRSTILDRIEEKDGTVVWEGPRIRRARHHQTGDGYEVHLLVDALESGTGERLAKSSG